MRPAPSQPLLPPLLLMSGIAAASLGAALAFSGLRSAPAPALPPPAAAAAATLAEPAPLPDFSLTSHRGTPFTAAELRGRWTFLFFGYTHCPDVCPTTLSAMAELVQRLDGAPAPQVVFVSLDARRDTPQLLAEYVPAFRRDFIGATGPAAALAPLLAALGVFHERHPGPNGHELIDHTASVFLIDPAGRPRAVFEHPPRADLLAARYRAMIRTQTP